MQVYIEGTKKATNLKLSQGIGVPCVEYNLFTGDQYLDLVDCKEGTVIKFWIKKDYLGTPIAKSYGVFKKGKVV